MPITGAFSISCKVILHGARALRDVSAIMQATLRAFFSDLFIVKQEKHYKVADAAARRVWRQIYRLALECRKHCVVVNLTSFTFTMETYKSTQINGLSITVAMSTAVFFNPRYSSLALLPLPLFHYNLLARRRVISLAEVIHVLLSRN